MENIDSGEMKDRCMEFCVAFSLNCLLSKFKVNPIPPRNWWIEGWNVNNLLITKSYVVYVDVGMKDDFFQLNNIRSTQREKFQKRLDIAPSNILTVTNCFLVDY